MEFEKDQLQFINYIINNEKKGSIILNAPAGTGKTTVAKYLNSLLKSKFEIVFLAPTHKAANVLRKNEDKKINVKTIHQFLSCDIDYDDKGKIIYSFNENKYKNYKNYIIFIDECSMCNKAMIEAFEYLSKENLIVYMGDDLQLPPINDEEERFSESQISNAFKVSPRFEFKKNQRSKKETATVMLELARNACYSKKMPPKITDISFEDILQYYKKYYKLDNDNTSVIILAYTNVAVNNYNNKIRSFIFNVKEEDLEPYYLNECLVLGSLIRYTEDHNYTSSEIIQIKNISKENLVLSFDDFQCDCKEEDYNKVKCKEHGFRKGSMTIEFYKIIDQYNTIWYKPINPKQFYIMSSQFKQFCILNKKEKDKKINWPRYYSFINLYNAELKYEYAQTIHKSQGSQYNIVFVDRQNLIGCTTRNQTLRINGYYTAISRMQDEVYDIAHN
jgi:exodeoxyribonuclease-5